MSSTAWDAPVALTVVELVVPFDRPGGSVVADGSGRGSIAGCAAVSATGRALVGWHGSPGGPPLPAEASEFYAALLGLRLGSRGGTAILAVDSDPVLRELRRAKAGDRVDAAALGFRDDSAFREVENLASNPAISIGRADGAAAARANGAGKNVVHGSAEGVAAHSLAWAVRTLRQDGHDPVGDGIGWLTFLALRGGIRNQKQLSISYDKWCLRTGLARTVRPYVARRLSPGDQPPTGACQL
jgi:hypothetical protein